MTDSSVMSRQRQSDTDTTLVRCESVSREYVRGQRSRWPWQTQTATPSVTALADVSIAVDRGELVGIAGPSGSGKSTLLHVLAGLDTPTTGTVTLAGTDLGTCGERERTRLRLEHVGIVFQQFHLLPSLSARANVALPLVELGCRKSTRRERATMLLERVGLADRLTHRPGELSGGERQRVAVARALAADPDLVVADEPTGELDSTTGAAVMELLADVAADRAVVVASHDTEALSVVDRVHRLRDGRLIE